MTRIVQPPLSLRRLFLSTVWCITLLGYEFESAFLQSYEVLVDNSVKEIASIYGCWNLPHDIRSSIIRESLSSPYGARNIRNMVWEFFMENEAKIPVSAEISTLPKGEELDRILESFLAAEYTSSA